MCKLGQSSSTFYLQENYETASILNSTAYFCGVPVYVSAFARTHCAYAGRDGQAELTCDYT